MSKSFTYDDAHNLETITDAKEQTFVVNTYDSEERVIALEDAISKAYMHMTDGAISKPYTVVEDVIVLDNDRVQAIVDQELDTARRDD